MSLIFVDVKTLMSGLTPGMTARNVKSKSKLAYLKIGQHWASKWIRFRFLMQAYNFYSLRKRTVKYSKRKKKLYGHNLPFVFSGTTRSLSKKHRITSNSTRCVVRLNVRQLNRKPAGWPYPMRTEFVRIPAKEFEYIKTEMTKQFLLVFKGRSPSASGGAPAPSP